ncbi:DUF1284 domain-containing protein [Clostridium oryzae]|uniref:DUF1284 domain-containing protein n=1 Tax=Clostridium oryzae TaxID=1450648 RepID=A0A1V4IX20_9CLOT|nr:DUF1284 domain-containing protein [Clostridium oryzae]OPJ64433.1 hypothetical protein CLORY_06270 [Clostridium oryzae]
MIKLRPHHIMCFQGYEGKGYSQSFVLNMNRIHKELNEKAGLKIKIVFSTDDVCKKCPNKLSENYCSSNEKVMNLDSKVIRYLRLEEKIYTYAELVDKLSLSINGKIMDDVCGKCEWYKTSKCRANILNLAKGKIEL